MTTMSQDQNSGRVAPVVGNDAKTPLDRAKQIQEMQRQLETPGAPTPGATALHGAAPAAKPVTVKT